MGCGLGRLELVRRLPVLRGAAHIGQRAAPFGIGSGAALAAGLIKLAIKPVQRSRQHQRQRQRAQQARADAGAKESDQAGAGHAAHRPSARARATQPFRKRFCGGLLAAIER